MKTSQLKRFLMLQGWTEDTLTTAKEQAGLHGAVK